LLDNNINNPNKESINIPNKNKANNKIQNNKNNENVLIHIIHDNQSKNNLHTFINDKLIIIYNNIIIINKNILTSKLDIIDNKDNKNATNKNLNENININKNKNNNKNIINNTLDKYIVNNINNINNINNSIIINNNHISLNENDEEKEVINNIPDERNIIKNKEKIDNIKNISKMEESNRIDFDNKKLLQQKRDLKELYDIIVSDHLLFINSLGQILNKRKIIYEINNLLNYTQLDFIIDKVEKNIPEFRFLNLVVHSKIIYEINSKTITDNNSQKIISEFYEKSKNIKNLIFLIKTTKNKMFGGFTQVGFKLSNDKIYANYFDSNSFFFLLIKRKFMMFVI
jgi:hypothetical protein